MINTRHIFFKELSRLMSKDNDIFLLLGDLGFSYCEKLKEKYPDRVINCGCAEQNMIGIACGLALTGKKVYVYSTIPFILFRPLEQVRNDIAQQKLNVKLIGVSMSGFIGFTHTMLHPKEDINLCKNIKLKCHLADKVADVKNIINKTYNSKETCYIRL